MIKKRKMVLWSVLTPPKTPWSHCMCVRLEIRYIDQVQTASLSGWSENTLTFVENLRTPCSNQCPWLRNETFFPIAVPRRASDTSGFTLKQKTVVDGKRMYKENLWKWPLFLLQMTKGNIPLRSSVIQKPLGWYVCFKKERDIWHGFLMVTMFYLNFLLSILFLMLSTRSRVMWNDWKHGFQDQTGVCSHPEPPYLWSWRFHLSGIAFIHVYFQWCLYCYMDMIIPGKVFNMWFLRPYPLARCWLSYLTSISNSCSSTCVLQFTFSAAQPWPKTTFLPLGCCNGFQIGLPSSALALLLLTFLRTVRAQHSLAQTLLWLQ